MAPRGRRADSEESGAYHELGVRGRKTGAVLHDTGERDEHGFQPVDAIFSSPRKGADEDEDDDDDGSVEMDIADSAGPGPRTLLRDQRNRLSQPAKSQSPVTSRKSPKTASRPSRLSSPLSASEDEAEGATRKIDFSAATNGRPKTNGLKRNAAVQEESEEDEDEDEEEEEEAEVAKAPAATSSKGRGRPKGPSPKKAQPPPELEVSDEDEDSEGMALLEASMEEVDSDIQPEDDEDDDDEQESEPEPEPEPEPQPTKKRGRPPSAKKTVAQKPSAPVPIRGKKRGPTRDSTGDEEQEEEKQPEEPEEERRPKRAKTTKASELKPTKAGKAAQAKTASASTAPTETKPKGRRGRKPKGAAAAVADEDSGETSFMAIQRGPPLPKSRGLVSVRTEPDVITQTRSGRQSFKPLNYWRGEQVISTNEAHADAIHRGKGGFVVGGTKEIVRVDDDAPGAFGTRGRRGGASRGGARGRPRVRTVKEEPEEEEELEDWENSPGTIDAEVILWENEHEMQPPAEDDEVQVRDERLAISAPAIHMRDIKDATFRFAKTLTLPFMGAGVVDLPPGSEKRPKNSRKMHLVFFVHTGKVEVGVNEVTFRISAGGIWFVPRGNYYRISNDYDKPARIFFSQGCEMSSDALAAAGGGRGAAAAMGDMSQMSIMAPGGSD
ncbi:hypothetical protein N3K66_003573 [Trichothecium roseum]|uniref:Uncharacterized protein n=1 Tax=Trichothecium roseum TaxID=47278 RepID=A0ACC0V5T0_9HYPO|nr:hypothetical protein N3K66_003573 [Trichothecium roseum]